MENNYALIKEIRDTAVGISNVIPILSSLIGCIVAFIKSRWGKNKLLSQRWNVKKVVRSLFLRIMLLALLVPFGSFLTSVLLCTIFKLNIKSYAVFYSCICIMTIIIMIIIMSIAIKNKKVQLHIAYNKNECTIKKIIVWLPTIALTMAIIAARYSIIKWICMLIYLLSLVVAQVLFDDIYDSMEYNKISVYVGNKKVINQLDVNRIKCIKDEYVVFDEDDTKTIIAQKDISKIKFSSPQKRDRRFNWEKKLHKNFEKISTKLDKIIEMKKFIMHN